MQIRVRIKVRHLNLFFMAATTQRLAGLTSKIENTDLHVIMWDMVTKTWEQSRDGLRYAQRKYLLPRIVPISDRRGSYLAYCLTPVRFPELMQIILDTPGVDKGFVIYTMTREEATLRITRKRGRKWFRRMPILEPETPSPRVELPVEALHKLSEVIYDTGTEKTGYTVNIVLGEHRDGAI